MRFAFLTKYRDTGLLLLRVSLGIAFLCLSAPTLTGGTPHWVRFAAPARAVGAHAHLALWGFFGALASCVGGVLLLFGLFFRIGLLLVLVTTGMHALALLHARAGFPALLPPFELCLILASLLLIGPGRFSVDKN